MPTSKGVTKSAAGGPWAVKPPRMRAPLAKAVDLIATKGLSQTAAAEVVGMNISALCRALNKPDCKLYLEARKAQFSLDADQLKGQARSIAIHAGIHLLNHAQSEAVKARMVELFVREAGQALVNVSINGPAAQAYSFTKPALPDSPSGGDDGQAIDITPQSDDC